MDNKRTDADRVVLRQKRGTWRRFGKVLARCRLPWVWLAGYIVLQVGNINIGLDETEYTGAGKHIQPQLAFARKNGIDILFGDPAEEIPGTNIILPARPSLLKAREADLDHMRKSLIRRQATRATGPVTAAEIAYLAEETNSNDAFVQGVLKELGYELA